MSSYSTGTYYGEGSIGENCIFLNFLKSKGFNLLDKYFFFCITLLHIPSVDTSKIVGLNRAKKKKKMPNIVVGLTINIYIAQVQIRTIFLNTNKVNLQTFTTMLGVHTTIK